MNSENRIGAVLLVLGALFLLTQFVVAFSLPLEWRTGQREEAWRLILHFTPLALLFSGAYILFRRGTPGIHIKWVRVLLTLLASWGLAGTVFFIIFVAILFIRGVQGVEQIFPYLIVGLVVSAAGFYPFVYRRLR